MPTLHHELASLFGFHAFRPHQEEVVRAVMAGRDTFTVMPTGGGKSLCYQLPARLLPGVCVVVSPLIALMKDQVDAARATGLAAAAFNSTSSGAEKAAVVRDLAQGSLDLLYISPERLRVAEFVHMLRGVRIAFFAIDEAHCISEWGHDFRPDYLALSELGRIFPGVPLAAFTATATHHVERDIIERLALREPMRTRASFNRPNLFYQVTPKDDLDAQLLAVLRARKGEPGIIYRTSRKDVEATAAMLNANGHTALPYHAGLGDAERAAAQDAFRADTCPIIVATIAFGMGIDKSNVRFVLHGDLPKSLESYYQETGRAGRDGEPAYCGLFYGRKDIARLLAFAGAIADPEARHAGTAQVYRMLDFTQGEGCRRKALLAYFGEDLPGDNCGSCDICTGQVEREDARVAAQKLLSAMVRTQCRFGARHVVSIVLGKETPRMRASGHHLLPTFGVGRESSAAYWQRIMDAMLAQGLAVVEKAEFPIPAITPLGWEVLRGQRPFSVVRAAARVATAAPEERGAAQELLTLLREERARLARLHQIPPYVVFSDATLREMATTMPDTQEKMLTISGVGQHKLARFGEVFLVVIRFWRAQHPDTIPPEADALPVARPRSRKERSEKEPGEAAAPKRQRGDSLRETERLLDAGHGIEEVATLRALSVTTVYAHMEQLIAGGKQFDALPHMEPERLAAIHALFCAAADWKLGPVVEASRAGFADAEPGGVSYDEARLARLLLQNARASLER